MTANLAYIRQVTREVSGRMSPGDFSNADIDEEINNYLRLEFLGDAKIDAQQRYYEFNTVIGQRDYAEPSDYIGFEPIVTCDEQYVEYYQDPNAFYQDDPQGVYRSMQWIGDAVIVTFTATLAPSNTILAGSVIVNNTTAPIETFTDDGSGVLTGDLGGSGTVDYDTGAVSVTFNTAPASGDEIWISYIQVAVGQPGSVLYYANNFKFWPVPDNIYRIRMKGWVLPVSLTAGSQSPESQEWSLAIAYGAAIRILSRAGEMERIAEVSQLHKMQIAKVLRRTINQMINTRGAPNF